MCLILQSVNILTNFLAVLLAVHDVVLVKFLLLYQFIHLLREYGVLLLQETSLRLVHVFLLVQFFNNKIGLLNIFFNIR